MADTMKITILDDGTIKVETDSVSPQNHMSAEAFMRHVATAGGGKQSRKHNHGVLGEAQHALQHALGKAHSHKH